MTDMNYKKLIRTIERGINPYGNYSALAIRRAIGYSLIAFFEKLKTLRENNENRRI